MSKARNLADSYTDSEIDSDVINAKAGRKNLIINGAMQVAQRGTSAVTTDAGFAVDRWQFSNTDAGDFEIQQDTDAPVGQGFRNSIKWTCNTGSSTTGSQAVRQHLEVQDSTDILDWHTSGGKDVTLSFWIKGSQSGTITTSVREGTSGSACFCNLTEVTTSWVKKSITIPAPTIGTWSTVANEKAVAVVFAFANHGTANTSNADVWEASNNISLTTQTNWTSITGAEIYITGVQLELGSQATDFEYRRYGEELALCQRYYQIVSTGYTITTAPTFYASSGVLTQVMRTTPTILGSSILNGATFLVGATAYQQITAATSTVIGSLYLDAEL